MTTGCTIASPVLLFFVCRCVYLLASFAEVVFASLSLSLSVYVNLESKSGLQVLFRKQLSVNTFRFQIRGCNFTLLSFSSLFLFLAVSLSFLLSFFLCAPGKGPHKCIYQSHPCEKNKRKTSSVNEDGDVTHHQLRT